MNETGQFVRLFSKTRVVHTTDPAQAIAWNGMSDRLLRDKAKIMAIADQTYIEVIHPSYAELSEVDTTEVIHRDGAVVDMNMITPPIQHITSGAPLVISSRAILLPGIS
jgi:acetyl/propionyl-CoA carboxylase alpha subunit